jgi:hypothetical protein
MDHDHWLDRLNKALVSEASRRGVVRLAAALSGWRLFGGATGIGVSAAKKKRCAEDLCARYYKSKRGRKKCEEKCGRCRVRAKFCIKGPDLAHPNADLHATCCKDGFKCCQDTLKCCKEPSECCPASHVAAGKLPCCGNGKKCCLESESGCCATGDPGPSDCLDGRPRCNGRCCDTGWSCFGSGGNEQCCTSDKIPAPCTFADPNLVCVYEENFVCCDGNGHARNPPEDYWCCGRGPHATSFLATDAVRNRPDCYPPISIHRAP